MAWQWMPVPVPGLSVAQLESIMQEVDRTPYMPPSWLTKPGRGLTPAVPSTEVGRPERNPNNPLDWMPVPPPVISMGQRQAKAEAFGLN